MKHYLQDTPKKFSNKKKLVNILQKVRNSSCSFLCGFSTGQDSLVGFLILWHFVSTESGFLEELKHQKNNKIYICYCHHFWQRKNFVSPLFVFRLTYSVGVPFLLSLPLPKIGCNFATEFSNENKAREWRKQNLSRASQLLHTAIIVSGHTQTDTIETVLTKLLRGTSSKAFGDFALFTSKKNYTRSFSSVADFSAKAILFFPPRAFFGHYSMSKFGRENIKTYLTIKTVHIVFSSCSYLIVSKSSRATFLYLKPVHSKRMNRQCIFSFFELKKNLNVTSKSAIIQMNSTFYQFSKQKRLKQNFPFAVQNRITSIPFLRKKEIILFIDFGEFSERSSSFHFCNHKGFHELCSWKPLETKFRNEILYILDFYKLPVITDLTNFSLEFSRNRIRYLLLPFVRFLFQNKTDLLLNQCFETIKEDCQIVNTQLQTLYFLYEVQAFTLNSDFDLSHEFLEGFKQTRFLSKVICDYTNLTTTYFQIVHLNFQLLAQTLRD